RCDRARRLRGSKTRADRDHALDSGGPSSLEYVPHVVERVEVRVRVDHTGSSFLNSGTGSPSRRPARRSVGPPPLRPLPYSPVKTVCVSPPSSLTSRKSS